VASGTYAGIDEGVLYRRGAARADPGICVRGASHPIPLLLASSLPFLSFPYCPYPSPPSLTFPVPP